MDRMVGSYGVSQKQNQRIIDSDEDVDTLDDGTLLNNMRGRQITDHIAACDSYLRAKSQLNDALFKLVKLLTPGTVSNSQQSLQQFYGLQYPKRHQTYILGTGRKWISEEEFNRKR